MQCEDRPASGNTGRLFLCLAGRSAPTGLAYCPLDRVLTFFFIFFLVCYNAYDTEKTYISITLKIFFEQM